MYPTTLFNLCLSSIYTYLYHIFFLKARPTYACVPTVFYLPEINVFGFVFVFCNYIEVVVQRSIDIDNLVIQLDRYSSKP